MDTFWRLNPSLALYDYIGTFQHDLYDIASRALQQADMDLFTLYRETFDWVDGEGLNLLFRAADRIRAADPDLRMLFSEKIDEHIKILEEQRKICSDEEYLRVVPDLIRQFCGSLLPDGCIKTNKEDEDLFQDQRDTDTQLLAPPNL